MPRSLNPKTQLLQVRVTEKQKEEIERRAEAAQLTTAEYVRDRALGKACSPVEEEAPRKRAS